MAPIKQGDTDLKAWHEDTEIKVVVSKRLRERSWARHVCKEVAKRIGSAAEGIGVRVRVYLARKRGKHDQIAWELTEIFPSRKAR